MKNMNARVGGGASDDQSAEGRMPKFLASVVTNHLKDVARPRMYSFGRLDCVQHRPCMGEVGDRSSMGATSPQVTGNSRCCPAFQIAHRVHHAFGGLL